MKHPERPLPALPRDTSPPPPRDASPPPQAVPGDRGPKPTHQHRVVRGLAEEWRVDAKSVDVDADGVWSMGLEVGSLGIGEEPSVKV